ncbi:MAG TPA: hypothetical protein EYP24_03185 [bacterium (Candidatus Stahlbacteria)]|nr:hypothetical protein [Candidatus Stahlbacteria bacterium]
MSVILIAVVTLTASIRASPESVVEILKTRGIPIEKIDKGTITSGWVPICLEDLNNYITENLPDKNPGWTKARYSLTITISRNAIEIETNFERFGVPNAYLLIPPAWVPVPSNGNLENELLEIIRAKGER